MPVNGIHTWYAIHGHLGQQVPLVVLHGGPGYPSPYLYSLAALADQQPIIFYDQIGCGRSDRHPREPWSVELFVYELHRLRHWLGLEQMDLLGHSWGGALACEYTLAYPEAVRSIVLSSPLFDSALWVHEADRLRDQLDPDIARILREHEAAGTTNAREYYEAYEVFQQHFECQLQPTPEPFLQSSAGLGVEVYHALWGPSESCCTGLLADWSLLGRLPEIRNSCLVISGSQDTATPAQVGAGALQLPSARWEIFEGASHALHLEQPERYQALLREFLKNPQVDGSAGML